MATDLQSLWERNRRWRAWMDANTPFKTPNTLDCLRYALCESAEALDAWLRQKNQAHARNNSREHTIEQELADTAMLLLTALPGIESHQNSDSAFTPDDMDQMIARIVDAIWHYRRSGSKAWMQDCREALLFIVAYPGFDLATELDKCHRRLAWKHGSAALAAAGNETPWMVEAEVAA